MELEIFDSSTIRSGRVYKAAVHINKSGVFAFNPKAFESLNLTKGTTISFVRDKDNPLDWYIIRDPNGMELRSTTKGTLICNCKMVRELMYMSLSSRLKKQSMKFLISREPVQHDDKIMYAILTTKPL